jgi:DnaJ-class molecular chaperone
VSETDPDDHYAILGVERGSSAAEIRRAYRHLALRVHPDRAGPQATERFQRIALAYRVLSNPADREAYDRSHRPRAWAGVPPAAPGGRHALVARLSAPLPELVNRGVARHRDDGVIELILTAAETREGGIAGIGVPLRVPCPTCGGCARPASLWCARCEFEGTIIDDVIACVAFPPDVADGMTFTVRASPLDAVPPLRVRVRCPRTP